MREKGDGMTEQEREVFVEDLNSFYCKFDTHDFSEERGDICNKLEQTAKKSMCT